MAHKLRNYRESFGFSVHDLHILSGVSTGTINRIEREDLTYKVNDSTAKALAYGLDVEVSDLFTPLELSHIGRTALTGKPIAQSKTHNEEICTGCNLAKPVIGYCEACEVMPLAG